VAGLAGGLRGFRPVEAARWKMPPQMWRWSDGRVRRTNRDWSGDISLRIFRGGL
jgi:hypothetical protein